MIAVIDDDEATRRSLERLLRSHGLASESFPSATDFLGSAHVGDCECLILDVQMPGMTGLQLHRHLMKAGYSIPTIYVTGYVDEAIKASLKDPNTCLLEKPFDEKALMVQVHAALQAKNPRRKQA
jgi:FixJ family two-component response regulator